MVTVDDYSLFFGEVRLTYGQAMAQEIRQELEAHPERMNDDYLGESLLDEMHKRHPEIRKSMQDVIEGAILGLEEQFT